MVANRLGKWYCHDAEGEVGTLEKAEEDLGQVITLTIDAAAPAAPAPLAWLGIRIL